MAYKNKMVRDLLGQKEQLISQLSELSIVEKIFPSDANFLLVKFKDSPVVFDHLLKNKIIVRDRSNLVHCENCLRITVGTAQENMLLLQSLSELV
jgi:histidinol-phosphate aminotransferase